MGLGLLTYGLGAAAWGLYKKRTKVTDVSLRQKVVKAALSQVGRSDPTPYWLDVAGKPQSSSQSWCGAFALWCLHQAGLALHKYWTFGYGFLLTQPTPLPTTRDPRPGDIAYFTASEHQAVIVAVYPDRTIELVNGNGEGRVVTHNVRRISETAAIYSIQPYIDLVLGQRYS